MTILWITFALAYVDRQAIFSLFPILRSQLTFSEAQLGLTGSVFLWVYGICSPLAGLVGDRFPRAVVIVSSAISWSIVMLGTGFANSPEWVLVGRAALGATQCVYVPSAFAAIAAAHPDTTKSRALSVFITAQFVGITLGGWYGGFIGERMNWRWVFWLAGGIGIVYGLGLWPLVRGLLPRDRSVSGIRHRSNGGVLRLLSIPSFMMFCAAAFVNCGMLWSLYTWLPSVYTERFKLSLSEAGLLSTLSVQVTTCLGVLCGGVVADNLVRRIKAGRSWLLVVGMLGAAPSLYFLANASTFVTTQVAACSFGLFSGLYVANIVAAIFDVVQAEHHATSVGVLNFTCCVSGGLAAYLLGLLKEEYGTRLVMSWIAITGLLALVILIVATMKFFPTDHERAHAREETR